jgi:hypothetical protein
MKREKVERKIQLNKSTVENLETLEKFEQKVVTAGSDNVAVNSTVVPIFCEP